MTVTHGADVARLREIGRALQAQGEALAQVEDRGSSMLLVLQDAWSGPDLVDLTDRWGLLRSSVSDAAQALDAFGRQAQTQADEQLATSDTAGPGGWAGDVPGARTTSAMSGRDSARGDDRAEDDPDERAREAPEDGRTEDDDRAENRDPETAPAEEERPDPGPSLGDPVPGESLPQDPEPPPWSPVDGGAGEHGSEFAGPLDYSTEAAARAGAAIKEGDWPDAARNLEHYLDNSGEPLEQDVDQMLEDCDELAADAATQRDDLAADAVADAKERGITEPVTYPVHTPWAGHYIDGEESQNWFYATGGMEYSQTGSVTVYPPDDPGGPYRYEMSTTVNYRDQYNWDGSKSTEIGPFTVSDAQLAALHRAGIAQEFEMRGESSEMTTEGEIP